MEIIVVKRDGREETFSLEKIERVITAAGLTQEKAQPALAHIEDWSKTLGDAKITSLQVRDKVLEELRLADDYAANMFSWYEKTKEKPHKVAKK